MKVNSDLPLDERHLAFNKMLSLARQRFPLQRRISTQLLIKNPSDSRRLATLSDSVTADTFYNYLNFNASVRNW